MTIAHISVLVVLLALALDVSCDDLSDLTVQYFEQRVDHFGFHKRDTFRQKYLISDKVFQAGAPIFFYCGGEMNVELHARQSVRRARELSCALCGESEALPGAHS